MIAGSGGQGILFLGKIICQAAMLEGKNVTWFPSYGAEMRGGTASCTVVVSPDMIGSPIVKNPDTMIILNSASLSRYQSRIVDKGYLFYDSSLISNGFERKDLNVSAVPSSKIAEELGNPRLSNMVLLGAFTGITNVISADSVRSAIDLTVPSSRAEIKQKNIDAIERGLEFVSGQKG